MARPRTRGDGVAYTITLSDDEYAALAAEGRPAS
jgi:hypothetical protein